MEKLEFGGITGHHYGECVAKIYKDFSNHCQELMHSQNNPLDISSQVTSYFRYDLIKVLHP